jgi:hypothetical protein
MGIPENDAIKKPFSFEKGFFKKHFGDRLNSLSTLN